MNTPQDSMTMIRNLARGELSTKARLGYVALLLAATGMSVVIVSLWLTEPVLSLRTQLAFGAMSAIGVSWIALSLWALSTRRVLFARDRVIAGRMAVTFTSIFLTGALAAVFAGGGGAAFGALATGAVMLAAALWVLAGAKRKFAALAARRAALESELA